MCISSITGIGRWLKGMAQCAVSIGSAVLNDFALVLFLYVTHRSSMRPTSRRSTAKLIGRTRLHDPRLELSRICTPQLAGIHRSWSWP